MKKISFLFLLLFVGFMHESYAQTCTPPQNLAGQHNASAVELSWKNSQGYDDAILQWDQSSIGGSMGAPDFYYAVRFSPADLQKYAEYTVQSVVFLPYRGATTGTKAEFTLCVWISPGGNAIPNEPTYTQRITSYRVGAWNEIALETPQRIPAGSWLYVGFHATCSPDIPQLMATYDYNNYSVGNSQLVSKTGTSWDSFYHGNVYPVSWLIHTRISSATNSSGVQGQTINLQPDIARTATTTSDLFAGYNIYREGEKIASRVKTSNYVDYFAPSGTQEYKVTAVYDESDCNESAAIMCTVSDLCQGTAKPAPYTYGFEDNINDCWTQHNEDGSMPWAIRKGGLGRYAPAIAHEGTWNAIFNGELKSTYETTKLISPAIDLSGITSAQLSFWRVQEIQSGFAGSEDLLKIYYRTSPDANWVLLEVFKNESIQGWTKTILDLPEPSGTYQIAFEGIAVNKFSILLDEIYIGATQPTCAAPQNLAVVLHDPLWYNAKLSWSAPVGATPDVSYNVYRMGTKLNDAPITGLTYTDLLPGAGTYLYSVAAQWSNPNCESTPVEKIVTTTSCGAGYTDFPLVEDFENGVFSECWTQVIEKKYSNWAISSGDFRVPNTAHSGNYKATFNSALSARTKLILPMLNTAVLEKPTLSFWHAQSRSGYGQDSLIVYYRTSEQATWVPLARYLDPIEEWQEEILILPESSETFWIAFEAVGQMGNSVMLDDVRVGEQLICNPPTNLTSTVEDAKVTLTWNVPEEVVPTNYNVYRNDVLQTTTTATSYTQNTVPNGTYTYCVKAVYAECESEDVCEDVIVDYVLPSYTITASAGANGAISPAGATTVTSGDSQEYTITANEGYKIKSVLIDDVAETGAVGASSYSYTFTNVIANHTIAANFEATTYSITATAGVGGSISPSGNVAVSYGSSQSFTITANTGYKIAQVLVNGQNNTAAVASGSYTFTNVVSNQTISATFEAITCTITATAGANGTIAPSGTTTVTYGGNQAYTITADAGYRIKEVLIDGINNEDAVSNGSYTFVNVTANHTISAEFEQSIFTITATADANGTIAPNGATTLTYGDSQEYTITANEGYKIKSVLVDDVAETAAVGASSYSYTFSNVTANHTISAEFEQITYTIAATAGANGSITPGGTTTVSYGSNQAYTITANNDYLIKDVKVDGVAESAAVGKTTYNYTFSNVKANHTISATFEIANPELTGITVNNQPQTISSAMDYMAACGEQSVSMTLTSVGEVKVNGAAYTNGSPISLTGDKTVITITVTAGSNTATYTLTVAKALGDATPLYIERWGATIAIVNNPANNGGYTFDQIQWYKASDNTPAGTGAYVVGNISTHYADVHAVETGAWHHTCRTKATPAPVQIVVYPNPVLAAQTLNVKLPEGLNEVNIDVYDINGKLVKQHPRVTTTLTAPTGTGIYVLKIQLPDGSITTEKIVVK